MVKGTEKWWEGFNQNFSKYIVVVHIFRFCNAVGKYLVQNSEMT